ncbi:MAG: hypothetical protein P8105_05140 [Dehalococcoidia bacterium]
MNRVIHVFIALLVIVTGTCFSMAHPVHGFAKDIMTAEANTLSGVYDSAADSFWTKIYALEEISWQASETGQAVGFGETFSEDEINAALEEYAANYNGGLVKIKDIKVFLYNDSVSGVASCALLGMDLSLTAVPDIWVENGKPGFKIISLDIEGAPRFVNGMIKGMINQLIDAEYDRLLQEYESFKIDRIVIGSGQVTITGVAG